MAVMSCTESTFCRKCSARPGQPCKRSLLDRVFLFRAGRLHSERIEDYTDLMRRLFGLI